MYSVDHNTYPHGLNDAGSVALAGLLSPTPYARRT